MQAANGLAPERLNYPQTPKKLASWWHLTGFLAIQAGFLAVGLLDQGETLGGGDPQTARLFAQHAVAVHVAMYLAMIPIEYALLIYCLTGVRKRGGNLETLSGGRWTSWRGVVADMAIALPFWLVLQAVSWTASRLLGPDSVDSVGMLPHKVPEILAWILVSFSAGVCEEIVYRGYLQQQLRALSGSVVAAILGQGLVFGLAHAYQGWKSMIVVTVIGVLLGLLATWRRNLRTNMIVHTWVDVWEGWLKFAI